MGNFTAFLHKTPYYFGAIATIFRPGPEPYLLWSTHLGQLYLGVDGGGTRCRMRLTDQGLESIAEAEVAMPSNLQVRNGDAAHAAITRLTGMVFEQAGLDMSMARRTIACFGMAGARMKSARDSFSARPFPFRHVQVVDDIDIARAGAHGGADGAVLIIGTGSAGLGCRNGKRLQIGGWGFLLGDTMAGATLGRRLLRKSLLAFEEIEPPSPLTRAVMERFDNDPEKMMLWAFENEDAAREAEELYGEHSASPPIGSLHARPVDYGRFVPMVFDYFDKGDPVARELMEFELAAIDQFVQWFLARDIRNIAVVGGLGERLLPRLMEIYPGIVVPPRSDPLQGAVILAARSGTT